MCPVAVCCDDCLPQAVIPLTTNPIRLAGDIRRAPNLTSSHYENAVVDLAIPSVYPVPVQSPAEDVVLRL